MFWERKKKHVAEFSEDATRHIDTLRVCTGARDRNEVIREALKLYYELVNEAYHSREYKRLTIQEVCHRGLDFARKTIPPPIRQCDCSEKT